MRHVVEGTAFVPNREPDRIIEWSLMRMVSGDWTWFTAMTNEEQLAWIVAEECVEHVEVEKEMWGNTIRVWDVAARVLPFATSVVRITQ